MFRLKKSDNGITRPQIEWSAIDQSISSKVLETCLKNQPFVCYLGHDLNVSMSVAQISD
jgi:hypothetical protein